MFKYLQEIMDTKSEWIRNLSRKRETNKKQKKKQLEILDLKNSISQRVKKHIIQENDNQNTTNLTKIYKCTNREKMEKSLYNCWNKISTNNFIYRKNFSIISI